MLVSRLGLVLHASYSLPATAASAPQTSSSLRATSSVRARHRSASARRAPSTSAALACTADTTRASYFPLPGAEGPLQRRDL